MRDLLARVNSLSPVSLALLSAAVYLVLFVLVLLPLAIVAEGIRW